LKWDETSTTNNISFSLTEVLTFVCVNEENNLFQSGFHGKVVRFLCC
jgi:hypothetical protein